MYIAERSSGTSAQRLLNRRSMEFMPVKFVRLASSDGMEPVSMLVSSLRPPEKFLPSDLRLTRLPSCVGIEPSAHSCAEP